jgi:hypothetical protein
MPSKYFNPYESMANLFYSYSLDPAVFTSRLANAGALIAGSAALRVYLDGKVKYVPGDIDIYMQTTPSNEPSIDAIKQHLTVHGYKLSQITLDMYESSHIAEVQTYRRTIHEAIQLIILSCPPRDYIRTQLDISATATYWNPATRTFTPYDEHFIPSLQMYITNHYKEILADKEDIRHGKLIKRIATYMTRGFTLIEEPPLYSSKPDPRRNLGRFRGHIAYDPITIEEVPITDHMASLHNVLVIFGETVYAVNRIQLYNYICKKGRTYWSHKMSLADAESLLWLDHSIYIIRNEGHRSNFHYLKMPAFDLYAPARPVAPVARP